jgi:hypothetical protein
VLGKHGSHQLDHDFPFSADETARLARTEILH